MASAGRAGCRRTVNGCRSYYFNGGKCPQPLGACNAIFGTRGTVMNFYVAKKLDETQKSCNSPFVWVVP